jgi:hypothetical protein
MKLVQKQFLKGGRQFEIVDDTVTIKLRSAMREENSTVSLAVINPEPVDNGEFVEFHSRVKCGPLLSLLRDKPNASEFGAFVDELSRRAREEYHRFAGLKGGPRPAAGADSSAEAADDHSKHAYRRPAKPVDAERVDDAMRMLREYLDGDEIESMLSALETLKAEPEAEASMARLVHAFDDLGPRQGAALTYAPYIGILLSDDPLKP